MKKTLAILALLLCIAAPVSATATEADAIRAVVDEWIADEDSLNNIVYLEQLAVLWTSTVSPACRSYIDLVFSGIALFDAGQRYGGEANVGLESYTYVVTPFAEREYACRIAI